jgi:hypothetical protein
MGEAWASYKGSLVPYENRLKNTVGYLVGAVGIEPTTSQRWLRSAYFLTCTVIGALSGFTICTGCKLLYEIIRYHLVKRLSLFLL